MTFAELQARTQLMLDLEGWTQVSPSPDYANLVNRGYQDFLYDSECLIQSENITTGVGTASYDLTNTYKTILDVGIGSTGLLRSTEDFERNLNPAWNVQTSAFPTKWVLTSLDTITLVPPPNGAYTVSVRGIGVGTTMTGSSDVPQIPVYFHEAVACKASWLHGKVYAQAEGMQRIQIFDSEYQTFVNKAKNIQNNGWIREEGG